MEVTHIIAPGKSETALADRIFEFMRTSCLKGIIFDSIFLSSRGIINNCSFEKPRFIFLMKLICRYTINAEKMRAIETPN